MRWSPNARPMSEIAPDRTGAHWTKAASTEKPPQTAIYKPANTVVDARMADLHARGILTESEFSAKKAELLGRLAFEKDTAVTSSPATRKRPQLGSSPTDGWLTGKSG
jgi:hypothetical protein